MILKENRAEIEKFLQKIDKSEDEIATARLAVESVKGQMLMARDQGQDEKVIKLQAKLDEVRSKAEILELAIKKSEADTRKFIGKKVDAELKIYRQKEAEYKNEAGKLLAQIGTNLKNAREIAKNLPGGFDSGLGHIELCLSNMLPGVLRGRADVDTALIKDFVNRGSELVALRNLAKNITDKEYVINKIYWKAQRGDFE
jgi:hypothetical protein